MKAQPSSIVKYLLVFLALSLACRLPAPATTTKVGKDGMLLVYIPAGDFTMGTDNPYAYANEMPAHKVTLDAFWMDRTEVTNKMYGACVADGRCNPPDANSYEFGDQNFDDYPVTDIYWLDANRYCSWAGRRLPTEAEWEKAARGTNERTYPWTWGWGNWSLSPMERGPTTAVGSTPIDASPYEVMDMYANVSEWVADWYAYDYYKNSPSANPLGPEKNEGGDKVIRGQSNSHLSNVTLLYRTSMPYDWWNDSDLGFRCAVSD
ncbi:MAG: SUMF1/EgtB/PvdO family nonheme iron enzyme [Anaerolineales bacterium]|nr:MAG: SUMF1/EgtB/PvdO family nonheme iron enzyme [Anaerolineales bacterium]